MQKKVTIKDVAEQLGLSVTTVSLVLNNKGDIPESTRSRIRRVAEDMGYHPDYMARSLVTGKSHIVGVLVPDISNQFFAETVRHLQTELNNYGYDIILCNSEERMDNDIKYIEWLSGRRVDGLVLTLSAQSMQEENRGKMQRVLDGVKIPYVFLDRYYESNTPKILVDNVDGGYRVTKYLLDSGHTNIGLITGPMSLNSSANRLEGVQKAMAERGIALPKENIVSLSYDMDSGRQGAEVLIAMGVTAIFCFNDLQAYGVFAYVNEHGMKVPDDISLVGFDDIFYSSILETKLTTVRQHIRQMALETCKVVVKLLEGKPCPTEVKLTTELIVRDSVKDITK